MEKVFTNLTTGGPISVYVEDGKITRIRPLQVPEEDYPKPWTVEDRNGKKYSPPKAMRIAQNILAEKNRLYSEDRILYPMKRVDWDPNGERNPQTKGISGYERISWDEAAAIIRKKESAEEQLEYCKSICFTNHNQELLGNGDLS